MALFCTERKSFEQIFAVQELLLWIIKNFCSSIYSGPLSNEYHIHITRKIDIAIVMDPFNCPGIHFHELLHHNILTCIPMFGIKKKKISHFIRLEFMNFGFLYNCQRLNYFWKHKQDEPWYLFYLVEKSGHDAFHAIDHGMAYHTDPYYSRCTYNVKWTQCAMQCSCQCFCMKYGIMVEIVFNWTLANRQPNILETIMCTKKNIRMEMTMNWASAHMPIYVCLLSTVS